MRDTDFDSSPPGFQMPDRPTSMSPSPACTPPRQHARTGVLRGEDRAHTRTQTSCVDFCSCSDREGPLESRNPKSGATYVEVPHQAKVLLRPRHVVALRQRHRGRVHASQNDLHKAAPRHCVAPGAHLTCNPPARARLVKAQEHGCSVTGALQRLLPPTTCTQPRTRRDAV